MTTTQTIDGVPRDLLQKIADGGYCHQGLMDRLLALLDAPVIAICRGCFTEQPMGTACKTCAEVEAGRAAQPQGEPIYQLEYLGEGGGGWNDVDKSTYDRFERLPNYRSRIVYAEQPAPVANQETKINQCDGCQAGIPLVNGTHRMGEPDGYANKMKCTANLYK